MRKGIFKKRAGASVDSLMLTFVQLVTYGTNIVYTKMISVSLSLADYGTYSAVNLVLTLVTAVTLFGLGDCLNYYFNNQTVCREEDTRRSYVNTIYLVQFLIGAIAAAILVIAGGGISGYFENPALKPLLYIICMKPLLQNAVHLYQVLFVSGGRSRIIALRNLILALLRIVIAWYAVYVRQDLHLFFLFSLLIDVIQLVSFAALFGKTSFFVNIFKGAAKKIPAVLSYSLPMGIYFVMNTLMREVDKLVIGGLGTKEALAIYSNCSKLLPLNVIVSSFATVLVPHIMRMVSQKQYGKVAELFRNYLSIGYLSIWMFSGAILIVSREMLPFLYSDAYLPGLAVFICYIVDTMIQFASMHLIVTANGDTKYIMMLSIGALVVNAALSVALYYLFGLWGDALLGPAVATMLVTLIYSVLMLRKTVRILGEKISHVVPVGKMLWYFLQLVLTGAVFFGIRWGLLRIGMHRYLAMFLICTGYCLVNTLLCLKQYKRALSHINSYRIET